MGLRRERDRGLEKLHGNFIICTHTLYTHIRKSEMGWEKSIYRDGLDFVAQDSEQLHPIMITIMNLWVPYKAGSNVKE